MEQPAIIVNMADYPAQISAKALKLLRLQKDRYKLIVRQFDQRTGEPADPQELPLNRAGAETLAKGLEDTNAQLQAKIDSNLKAIANLRGAVIADMDALDKAALDAGDI